MEEVEERRDLAAGEGSREELLAVNWVSNGERDPDRLRWSLPSFEDKVDDGEAGVLGRDV